MPVGVDGPGGPGHALALTSISGVTEVGALPSHRVPPGDLRYYDPVGLPLPSVRLHHRLIRTVFADEAGQTGLSCSVTKPCTRAAPRTPEGPDTAASPERQAVGHGPSP